MRKSQPIILAAFAGLITAAAGQSSAGEPGIVRISDSRRAAGAAQAEAIPASAQHITHSQSGCNNCGAGNCDGAGYSNGGAFSSRYRKYPPDHGWGRPIKRPINRLPVMYQRYWPNAWYGQPGSGYHGANVNYYPAVYMPTDTTQLGYYYQRVPFWRPNPSMTPPVPWPSQWHKRECGATPFSGRYATAAYGGSRCASGQCGQATGDSPATPNLQPVPETAPMPQDNPPVPQSPANDTAENLIP